MRDELRRIPSVDRIVLAVGGDCPKKRAIRLAREIVRNVRRKIRAKEGADTSIAALVEAVRKRCLRNGSLKPLVNATGVLLHTNLGRAPVGEKIYERAKKIACGYSNLEYDTARGSRGDRIDHASEILCELFDCEAAMVVNNNAAAVFLVLNTFSKDKETVISRGELVEIGGSFRMPDVMAASGAMMKEVGTTNKTRLEDYEKAIGERTALLMKVHPSNYRIEGFTQSVCMSEISELARSRGLVDYYDLGSFAPAAPPAIHPDILPKLETRNPLKPSLFSFSGDKLFGGVQAGIVAGKRSLIEALGKNPLYRMLRVDKVTLALIEETALAWLREDFDTIALTKMLAESLERVQARAQRVAEGLPVACEVVATKVPVGGGSLPGVTIDSWAVALSGDAASWARFFREEGIVGRMEKGIFLLDMRAVSDDEVSRIISAAGKWNE